MTKPPLVCIKTLLELEASLGGEWQLTRNFVSRYVEMWPERFERIHAAVTAGNNAEALDSALSLRSSALMVGAARLGKLTSDLIELLECRSYSEATMKMASLKSCGNCTAVQLQTLHLPINSPENTTSDGAL